MPPAPVRVTSRCAAARLRISLSSPSRPISSETGSGKFVGGGAAAGSAAILPEPARSSGLADMMRISPVNW